MPDQVPPAGKILTFYSYKGGTGRSMTLANVAWTLASNGKRVLVIDWDLEAPGLHRYFYPFLVDKDLQWSDGLMNFVDDYKNKAMTPPAGDPQSGAQDGNSSKWYAELADFRRYSVSLQRDFPRGGRIDFVPAGRQDETYSHLVTDFSWPHFYGPLGGKGFLDAAAARARLDYDYVLIDSRTGVSDSSGVCVVTIPDALVVCYTLNFQGINGASGIADYVYSERRSAAPQSPLRFNVFPVPMRLEDAQTRKLEQRRAYARQKFKAYPIDLFEGTRENYWEKVGIDYFSFYAYEEILAAFGESERKTTNLQAAIERLTAYLTSGDVTAPVPLPQPDRARILQEFEGTEAIPAPAAQPSSGPSEILGQLPREQQDLARKIILRLVRVAEANEVEHTRQTARLSDFTVPEQELISTLSRLQLLRLNAEEGRADTLVQISPDASLREWREVQLWIEQDRSFLVWRQQLYRQLSDWEGHRKEEAFLIGDAGLTVAREFLSNRPTDLFPTEQAFIQASIDLQGRKDAERQRQLVLERAAQAPPAETTGAAPKATLPAAAEPRDQLRFPDAVRIPDRTQQENSRRALAVIHGSPINSDELWPLISKLKGQRQFGYARRLLQAVSTDPTIARQPQDIRRLYQQLALCTYKDKDLPQDERLDSALSHLTKLEDLTTTTDQETLGLAGAIHKRKWEVDGVKQHLECSLEFYLRGYRRGVKNDQGYTAINAAFVMGLLAQLSPRTEESKRLVEDATAILQEIVRDLPPMLAEPSSRWLADKWWFFATIGEAYFGLLNYSEALHWLSQGLRLEFPSWEYESTARQLATLARLQVPAAWTIREFIQSAAWKALKSFCGDDAAAALSAFVGKTGLTLSGGGFRAAFFHVGVLAKLAERDLLRHVEVLSCVSGGSIVGALYYLELRLLLQSKLESEIRREDYVAIVERVQQNLLVGVQRNIRTRVAGDLLANLRWFCTKDYSRTSRAGDLYEKEIYSRVDDGEGSAPRFLHALSIRPKGEKADFDPVYDNWRRSAKVPALILNAATLNTGHTWQFRVDGMGESITGSVPEVDGNEYLRQMTYWDAPPNHHHVRLGTAVAASSCVPAVFEPVILKDLYPDRVVRLVDGGVCDNQGLASLLERDCSVFLISDGSGQMETQADPNPGLLAVPLRSNSILQARVREAQYRELRSRKRSGLLRGLLYMHLKEDLGVDQVDWIGCPDPDPSSIAKSRGILTAYGIDRGLQQELSAIRTDLDSFSDVEACALMTSGYRIAEFKSSAGLLPFTGDDTTLHPWSFLAVEKGMKEFGAAHRYLLDILSAGSQNAFKVWRLSSGLQWFAGLVFLALMSSAAYFSTSSESFANVNLLSAGPSILGGLAFMAVAFSAYVAIRSLVFGATWQDGLRSSAEAFLMSTVGWLSAWIHLMVFDRMFLQRGSLKAFLNASDSSSPTPLKSVGLRRVSTIALRIVVLAAILLIPFTLFNLYENIRSQRIPESVVIESLIDSGRGYLDTGKYSEAIDKLDLAIRQDSRSIPAHLNRAQAFFKSRDSRRAIADIQIVLDEDPENADAHNLMGTILQGENKHPQAIESFSRALKSNPDLTEAYLNRARAYLSTNDVKNAQLDVVKADGLASRNGTRIQERVNTLFEQVRAARFQVEISYGDTGDALAAATIADALRTKGYRADVPKLVETPYKAELRYFDYRVKGDAEELKRSINVLLDQQRTKPIEITLGSPSSKTGTDLLEIFLPPIPRPAAAR